jgi:ATP-dependent helicase/nuclease subunit B
LSSLAPIAPIVSRLASANPSEPTLSRDLARLLYGRIHETSVSALEKFGACPFWFFVDSGLKADERKQLELDARQKGTFQHEVLEEFHRWVEAQGLTWHDLTPEVGSRQIGRIADAVIETFEEGMLKRSHENRFIALAQKERLQRLIGVLIGWMRQYRFEPAEVELSFGLARASLPAWRIEASDGYALALRGSIDRVDLFRPPRSKNTWCVVMDYKSRGKKLDEVFMAHGIQLQLPGYLAALVGIQGVEGFLRAQELRPAGIFFVNLSGNYASVPNRSELATDPEAIHKLAFQHIGRFDADALDFLDNRSAPEGDQFTYKRNAKGELGAQTKGPMPSAEFRKLLATTEEKMREFGHRIFDGDISVDPCKKGDYRACKWCEHAAICRIDPWSHQFRKLSKSGTMEEEAND